MDYSYDREQALKSRLNAFMQERLGLPADDYYSKLDQRALAELKSVLSDINNIFTLKVTLAFAKWLSAKLNLEQVAQEEIKSSILRAPPNANGYDIEISKPLQIIAEVKCNVPINRGAVYGSAQRDGLARDVNSQWHYFKRYMDASVEALREPRCGVQLVADAAWVVA